ncbi:MAG: STAS domain-containing protein [Hydrogenophilaceae bacterium]|nr:STAS domain-containing protein [Hydrogenophilaceae bacterium]
MAIPFFRKDRNKPEKVVPQSTGDGPPSKGLTTFGSAIPDNHGIVVEEVGGTPETALDEAAMLYASNQLENAEQTLHSLLAGNEPRAWHMLFDLYRLTGRDKEFEQLAEDYALKFETSPPNLGKNQNASSTVAKAGKTLSFDSKLDAASGGRLKDELTAAKKGDILLLDLSRITVLEAAGAAHLAEGLTGAKKSKATLQISGVSQLAENLKGKLNSDRGTSAWWLLLMAMYQLLGKQNEFEDLAVDYAVHFEVSPPSWENVRTAQEVAAPETPQASSNDAFKLKGVISETSQNQIAALIQFAQSRQEVAVDCSEVTRVDYAYIGSLISHLMQLLGSGKSIVLQGQNALINELFRAMGIDQLARLEPAKLV